MPAHCYWRVDAAAKTSLMCLYSASFHDTAAFAAERRRLLSFGISCPRGAAQQQSRRTPLLLSIDGTDGQTDGRTDARPFQWPFSTYYAGGANNHLLPYPLKGSKYVHDKTSLRRAIFDSERGSRICQNALGTLLPLGRRRRLVRDRTFALLGYLPPPRRTFAPLWKSPSPKSVSRWA